MGEKNKWEKIDQTIDTKSVWQGESAIKETRQEKNSDDVLYGFYSSALCEDFLTKY